jgi:hypothetical protein
MNRELLTKLYEEAVDYCIAQDPNPDGTNKAWIWEERFAELLIKECQIALLTEECNTSDLAMEEYTRSVKKINDYFENKRAN